MARKLVYTLPSRRWQPGDASKYISEFAVTPSMRVVLACRVSNRQRKSHLKDQEANLRHAVEEAHGNVVAVHAVAESGFYPSWLCRAVLLAKKRDAVVLAETTDRLVRHPAYHSSEYPDAQARTSDLEELAYFIEGVKVMTHLHPNASPTEVRAYHVARGQQLKNRKGGRPKSQPSQRGTYRSRYDDERLSEVLELQAQGLSIRDIAEQIGRPHSTVQGWINTAKQSLERDCTNSSGVATKALQFSLQLR